MGRSQRPRPTRLASKLLRIRLGLGLTQQQMFDRLDYRQSPLRQGHLSDFERDKREPPLPLLLAYARTAGVSLETLADDEADLPPSFPSVAPK
jgi:transcriptional regulator with XRE-family HTH domain